jgi:hypothetical protein
MAFGTQGSTAIATAITSSGTQTAVDIGAGKDASGVTIQSAITGTPTTGATTVLFGSFNGTNYSKVATRTNTTTDSWTIPVPKAMRHFQTVYTAPSGGGSSGSMGAQAGWHSLV